MSANRLLGMATSAIWKATVRPWRTTLAPILISFYGNVVRDPSSTSFGNVDVSCGSRPA